MAALKSFNRSLPGCTSIRAAPFGGMLSHMEFFSDQELGVPARTHEDITPDARDGILGIIRARLGDDSFGLEYPREDCPDGNAITGTNLEALGGVVRGLRLCWPLDYPCEPDRYQLLDLIQFCYQKVAQPQRGRWHGYGTHYHLTFDRLAGRAEFRDEVNLVFRRHGLVYELADNGQIQRLSPAVLGDALATALFNTGDSHLDQMLESARHKFRDKDPAIREESLEELWDAWERLKTVEPGKDKKESVARLLDKASSEPRFREILEKEATELTGIGNSFMIRHTEMAKTPIETSEHVDYLFHRMFALIRLLLRRSGRGG